MRIPAHARTPARTRAIANCVRCRTHDISADAYETFLVKLFYRVTMSVNANGEAVPDLPMTVPQMVERIVQVRNERCAVTGRPTPASTNARAARHRAAAACFEVSKM